MSISKKHKAFVDEYFMTGPNRFNATAAYMAVYPRSSYNSARANSARLLAKDSVQEEIKARLENMQMGADEALILVSDISRGDLGEFVNNFGMIDVSLARKQGKTKLIKKWKTKTVTINGKGEDREIHTEEIELYDALSALDKILRVHGKYKDVGSKDNPLTLTWKELINGSGGNSDANTSGE